MSDLTFLPATVMAQQIRDRKISRVELADAHLAKIERLNPKLNAFVHVDEKRVAARPAPLESAVMSGNDLGPLHGVPISIKSSLDVAWMRCEAGTRLRPDTLRRKMRHCFALRNAGQSCWEHYQHSGTVDGLGD